MSETRYIVTVPTDAAHGLEIVLEKAEPEPSKGGPVLITVKAPYPWGPRGFEVTSVNRIRPERHEERADLPNWDTKAHCTCGEQFVSRAELWKHQADALRGALLGVPCWDDGQRPPRPLTGQAMREPGRHSQDYREQERQQ